MRGPGRKTARFRSRGAYHLRDYFLIPTSLEGTKSFSEIQRWRDRSNLRPTQGRRCIPIWCQFSGPHLSYSFPWNAYVVTNIFPLCHCFTKIWLTNDLIKYGLITLLLGLNWFSIYNTATWFTCYYIIHSKALSFDRVNLINH